MKSKIDDIQIGERLRALSDARVAQLALSIDANGLLHPVVLSGSILVCGWHRLEACRSLGWAEIPAEDIGPKDVEQLVLIEVEENLVRQDVSAVERCIMLKLHKEIYDSANPGASLPGRKNGLKPYAKANPLELDIGPRRINQLLRIANEIPDVKRLAGTLLDDYKALDSLLLLKTKNADECARVLAEPNGETAADLARGIVRPPKLPTITLCGQEMSRKDAAIRLWQVQHNGEKPDEGDPFFDVDVILDDDELIRKLQNGILPGQEATRWQKRALKLLGSIIDNVERVPSKDKPAVMERIKELHGMVVNGAIKRRSAKAKPSRVQPLLSDRREEN